jgi:hypothetical protein
MNHSNDVAGACTRTGIYMYMYVSVEVHLFKCNDYIIHVQYMHVGLHYCISS